MQLAAERLAKTLDELRIRTRSAAGLAVFAHGHERMTKDVDVLLTADGLRQFRDAALGPGGWDTGDQAPRTHTFRLLAPPEPGRSSVVLAGKRVLALPHLVELKLASGLYAPERLQDFADVVALTRANALPLAFGEGLHEDVRAKWRELWHLAQRPQREP